MTATHKSSIGSCWAHPTVTAGPARGLGNRKLSQGSWDRQWVTSREAGQPQPQTWRPRPQAPQEGRGAPPPTPGPPGTQMPELQRGGSSGLGGRSSRGASRSQGVAVPCPGPLGRRPGPTRFPRQTRLPPTRCSPRSGNDFKQGSNAKTRSQVSRDTSRKE